MGLVPNPLWQKRNVALLPQISFEGTLKNPLHGIFQAGARKKRFPGAFIFKRLRA
jgi:hypothetical protein